jgi:hypothetical protein
MKLCDLIAFVIFTALTITLICYDMVEQGVKAERAFLYHNSASAII